MSQMKAEAIRRRLAQIVGEWGQPVRVGRSGTWATNPTQARISAMSNTVKFAWFRANESSNWAAPAFVVTLAESGETPDFGPVQIGDTIELPLGVYTVRKIDRPRVSGVVIKTTLFVARDV